VISHTIGHGAGPPPDKVGTASPGKTTHKVWLLAPRALPEAQHNWVPLGAQALLPRSSSAEWAAAPMEAIRLIDYEYAGLNAVAYDIANHWCVQICAFKAGLLQTGPRT